MLNVPNCVSHYFRFPIIIFTLCKQSSGGLFAVQEGYIDVQGAYTLFRRVTLMFRGVKW